MYKIIGADGKAYGPVSAEQIRQWITESRVNHQTQIQAEGSPDWKPLSSFPEFADSFGANAPIPPSVPPFQPTGTREAALQAVKGPALALKVTGILGLVAVGLAFIVNVLTLAGVHIGMTHRGNADMPVMFRGLTGGLGLLQCIIGAIIAVVILNGAAKMQALRNYQFAFTTAILAMLPCVSPCCWLGLPFGIWALVVLNQPHVKAQFGPN
ncbi:MAG: DUF4339 domain-containing protein [Verrucomicrobiota bacterium]